jgi:hypothetical protein
VKKRDPLKLFQKYRESVIKENVGEGEFKNDILKEVL